MEMRSDAYIKTVRSFVRATDSMGDMIGPNNMELSSALWAVSAQLMDYYKELLHEGDPSHD